MSISGFLFYSFVCLPCVKSQISINYALDNCMLCFKYMNKHKRDIAAYSSLLYVNLIDISNLYHWVDTSAGALLVPKSIIYLTFHVSPHVWFIIYIYY